MSTADDPREVSKREFIAAARRCFKRDGVGETNMAAIAEEAGLSRQYLYKLIPTRHDLIELAMLDRGREFTEELVARAVAAAAGDGDLREAFIEQLLFAAHLGRDDPEFVALAGALPRARVNHIFAASDSAMRGYTESAFAPLFERARREGLLRTDVEEAAMANWIQGVVLMLAGRDDLDGETERTLMRDFVLKGILA